MLPLPCRKAARDSIQYYQPGEGAEASFPHPDEIKSNDTIGARQPTVHRAEVKVRENEEDEGEDATNEII